MRCTVDEAIIRCLQAEGVEVVFGYPGAAICPLYDALRGSGLRHVLVRQEQNAGHAASGYARIAGRPGVCMVTSGPGATNLLTALATAYMDSVPLVALTGQVPTSQIGRDVFQEADITGAAEPFTKYSFLVKTPEDIPKVFKDAFYIASTGRPGPVLIDLPMDVQRKEIAFAYPEQAQIRGYKPTTRGHAGQIERVAAALQKARRPLLCAGGGVLIAGAQQALQTLCERVGMPVVTTMMGLGALPSEHPLNLGMLGAFGSAVANRALREADLLVVLGARLSDRAVAATGSLAAPLVHIDIDTAEIGKNVGASIPLVGDARLVLEALCEKPFVPHDTAWLEPLRAAAPAPAPRTSPYPDPRAVVAALARRLGRDAIVCADVGQNQIWTASSLRGQRLLTSGGMGTMGYALPAAVGAQLAAPGRPVAVVCGDGGLQMSMMELATLCQNRLPIKLVVMENRCLGMIREIQRQSYHGREIAVELDGSPDFCALAAAYGIPARRLREPAQLQEAVDWLADAAGAAMLVCAVDPQEPSR